MAEARGDSKSARMAPRLNMESNVPTSRPDPDPTALTTQALLREIGTTREIIHGEINEVKGVSEAKIAGQEKLIGVLTEFMGRIYEQVDTRMKGLELLYDQKFTGVGNEFSLRDKQADERIKDGKVAIDAALQAAKEAVGKQNESIDKATAKAEAFTTKAMDLQSEQLKTEVKSLITQMSDMKEKINAVDVRYASVGGLESRMAALESSSRLLEGRSRGHGDSMNVVVGAAAVLSVIIIVVGAIIGVTLAVHH